MWLQSRGWRQIGMGAPAVVAAVALVITLDAAQRSSPETQIGEYRRAAAEALHRGDIPAAELWFRKVVWIDESDPASQYALAMTVGQNGDEKRAVEILRRIAPANAVGYPEAHFWLACAGQRRDDPLSSEQYDVLVHDLTQALRSERRRTDAHVMLGRLALKRQRVQEAITYFEQAAKGDAACYLPLARLYDRHDQPTRVREAAGHAAEFFRHRAARQPALWQHHVNWAQSQLLLGDTPSAIEILNKALPIAKEPRPIRAALAAAYIQRLREVVATGPSDTRIQLVLLERALSSAPDCRQALMVLAELAISGAGETGELERVLQHALATGPVSSIVHLISGVKLCSGGNLERGGTHLALAEAEGIDYAPAVIAHLAEWVAEHDPGRIKQVVNLLEGAARVFDSEQIEAVRVRLLPSAGISAEPVTTPAVEDVLPVDESGRPAEMNAEFPEANEAKSQSTECR
jgi:tetratricopeptide (TPR) repeat protein